MTLLANTFVWLSLRNLAFLRLGKRWPELGSSTWVVAVPSLLSRFPFSQTFSGFKNTFSIEKKSHSTQSSGKLYIGQAFWAWQQHMGCRYAVFIVPLPFLPTFSWFKNAFLTWEKNQILPKLWKEKVHIYLYIGQACFEGIRFQLNNNQSLEREVQTNCTLDKLFGVKVTVDHGLSVLRLYCVPASLSCAANAKAAQRTTLLLFHFSQTRDASHIHISCFHSSSIQQHQNSFKSLCGLPDRSLRNVQITICYFKF